VDPSIDFLIGVAFLFRSWVEYQSHHPIDHGLSLIPLMDVFLPFSFEIEEEVAPSTSNLGVSRDLVILK
jgi:hypothetical protein